MSEINIINANFTNGRETVTRKIFQYDYGQKLKIKGINLPFIFQAHISNQKQNGTAKKVIGEDNEISIPDEYLISGQDIYIFIVLHQALDDGETRYLIKIPVIKRSKSSDQQPTPIQQDAIENAIAALNTAVETAEQNIKHYPKIIDEYWYIYNTQLQEYVNTGIHARGTQGQSAYQIAVKNGYQGTEEEWLLSFTRGEDGYTPVRGVDYWTEEDQNEINTYITNSIPTNVSELTNDVNYTTKTYVDGQITNVNSAIANKQNTLIFDSAPTANSTNPVISNGIKTAIDNIDLTDRIAKGIGEGALIIGNIEGDEGNDASGEYSYAEGYDCHAQGDYSHAEGYYSWATGDYSHSQGGQSGAYGNYSHAQGYSSAWGDYSHSEGADCGAHGRGSHVQGYSSEANGEYSHAEGVSTTDGLMSHSQGRWTYAKGDYSHAEGTGTTASHASQHVSGEYNAIDLSQNTSSQRGIYAEIVGNGTSNNDRSNARTLDWNGNEVLAGKLTIGSNPTSSMDVTTKQYVDNNVSNISNAIPTNVSELNNDSGYLITETDPTVPAWAKAAQKPTYTANEVGALPSTTYIPNKVSDLTNDENYQTDADVSAAIADAISQITGFDFEIVQQLPENGEKGIIYLIAHSYDVNDGYDEYIWVVDKFERLGNLDIDLSGYLQTSNIISNAEIDQAFPT